MRASFDRYLHEFVQIFSEFGVQNPCPTFYQLHQELSMYTFWGLLDQILRSPIIYQEWLWQVQHRDLVPLPMFAHKKKKRKVLNSQKKCEDLEHLTHFKDIFQGNIICKIMSNFFLRLLKVFFLHKCTYFHCHVIFAWSVILYPPSVELHKILNVKRSGNFAWVNHIIIQISWISALKYIWDTGIPPIFLVCKTHSSEALFSVERDILLDQFYQTLIKQKMKNKITENPHIKISVSQKRVSGSERCSRWSRLQTRKVSHVLPLAN